MAITADNKTPGEQLLRKLERLTKEARVAILEQTGEYKDIMNRVHEVSRLIYDLLDDFCEEGEEPWRSIAEDELKRHSPERVLRAMLEEDTPESMVERLDNHTYDLS